jgi:hypothetical protein
MCEVSHKIKFCTCGTEEISSLKDYWIFYRFNRQKDIMVIGDVMMPYMIDAATEKVNQEVIQERLNENGAFDVELKAGNNDLLLVSILAGPEQDNRLDYGYQFQNGRWIAYCFNPLEWEGRHDKKSFGKVCDALK